MVFCVYSWLKLQHWIRSVDQQNFEEKAWIGVFEEKSPMHLKKGF